MWHVLLVTPVLTGRKPQVQYTVHRWRTSHEGQIITFRYNYYSLGKWGNQKKSWSPKELLTCFRYKGAFSINFFCLIWSFSSEKIWFYDIMLIYFEDILNSKLFLVGMISLKVTVSPKWMWDFLNMRSRCPDLQVIDVLDLYFAISHLSYPISKRGLVWGGCGWRLLCLDFACSLTLHWVAAWWGQQFAFVFVVGHSTLLTLDDLWVRIIKGVTFWRCGRWFACTAACLWVDADSLVLPLVCEWCRCAWCSLCLPSLPLWHLGVVCYWQYGYGSLTKRSCCSFLPGRCASDPIWLFSVDRRSPPWLQGRGLCFCSCCLLCYLSHEVFKCVFFLYKLAGALVAY